MSESMLWQGMLQQYEIMMTMCALMGCINIVRCSAVKCVRR